ncbi:MAG TPA: hypothetical protein VGF99_13505, partial [Myxococcota bacterium]
MSSHRVIAAASVLLLLVVGCSRSKAPPPTGSTTTSATTGATTPATTTAPKKRIVIGISQEPDTLFMPFKEMNAAEHVGRPAALMLTVFDEKWQLVPQAAEQIPTVDNGGVVMNADGSMQVTWTLREGLF